MNRHIGKVEAEYPVTPEVVVQREGRKADIPGVAHVGKVSERPYPVVIDNISEVIEDKRGVEHVRVYEEGGGCQQDYR